MELYFDVAQNLKFIIQSDDPKTLKTLNTSASCLFAVNELKGFIGIYDLNSGVVSIIII